MGFCTNCGAEINPGSKFCTSCGKPVEAPQTAGAAQPRMTAPVQNGAQAGQRPVAPNYAGAPNAQAGLKISFKTILVIAVLAIAAVVGVVVYNNISSTINFNKYLTFETEGYDGYGKARVKIDWEGIQKKYSSKVSFTKNAKENYGGLLSYTKPMDVLEDYVDVSLDNTRNLTNGDELTYTFEIDQDLYKDLNCKIKFKDGKYTVKELTPIGKFDAFADLTVTFSGVAPNGEVEYDYTGSELDRYDFICDQRSGLSNGDKVVIKIEDSIIENCAERYGKVPQEGQKEYTVEGLSAYVTKLSEVTDDALTAMKQQANDVYYAHVAKSWGDGEELLSFDYLGTYLLTPKNDDGWGRRNTLYLVYRAQVRNTDKDSNDRTTYDKINYDYWYISFSDLMVNSDGTVACDVTSYNTPGDTFKVYAETDSWWPRSWYYYGYETLDELYKRVVTSNMDSYNHEDSVTDIASAAPATTQAADTTVASASSDDYILPDSDKKLLSKADLEGLTAEECKLARNEIYARHGRKFKDADLQAYFDSKDWYEGVTDPDDFKEEYLPEIERKNADTIAQYEKEKGY